MVVLRKGRGCQPTSRDLLKRVCVTSLIFGHASFIVSDEMPSLPGAKFFIFRRAASVSSSVTGTKVSCVICVQGSDKLMEMSFSVLSTWRSSQVRRACFSMGSESGSLVVGSVRGGVGN